MNNEEKDPKSLERSQSKETQFSERSKRKSSGMFEDISKSLERKGSMFHHLKETKAKQKWHVNQIGEVIFKGHQSFSIMKQIQMGLRKVLQESKPKDELSLEDFKVREKILFPSTPSTISPDTRSDGINDFVFYNYAAPAFRKLRERFGISQDHFELSLCKDKSLAVVGTPGKSGSLFFFSLDMQYIIKTINKKESKCMREILRSYYNVSLKIFNF